MGHGRGHERPDDTHIRRLDYWHRTNTDRAEGGATSLAAFVNQLTGTVVANGSKPNGPNTAWA